MITKIEADVIEVDGIDFEAWRKGGSRAAARFVAARVAHQRLRGLPWLQEGSAKGLTWGAP
jgi:hypothetical protein